MPESNGRRLIAFRLDPAAPPIRRAPSRREWMDGTRERFAYRCLPMVIANMSGWQILCPESFAASWDGRSGLDAIRLWFPERPTEFVQSHFGAGVLTFHLGYLFRTPPGFNLWVKGPTNEPRSGIMPLEGVVETDWSVAPFTMNWRFVRPGASVFFKKGEPFCTVLPVPRGLLESFEPEVQNIYDAEVREAYEAWRSGRSSFISELRADEETPAKQNRWQRQYFQGQLPDGERFEPHQTRLALQRFADDEEDEA